jgi:prolyl-tRNA editing enzyme YbaK/EbsC (Cys-tRNA(Pro) deacylase)
VHNTVQQQQSPERRVMSDKPAHKAPPPATLDRLRARLDAAAVRRTLLPLPEPADRPEDIAEALGVPFEQVVVVLPARADGDELVLIIPARSRVDAYKAAALVGARHLTLIGRSRSRAEGALEISPPALVSGYPTIMETALMGREYLYGPSGDPLWVLRITPVALRKVTQAHVGAIIRGR